MATGHQYSVLVIDDKVTARMGARALLAGTDNFRLVGEAASGHEALAAVAATHPDIVLVDVHMDGVNGAETARRIRSQYPNLCLVAWTSSDEPDDLIEMMHAGCDGYTLKDLGPSELNRALLFAIDRETPVPRQLVPGVIEKAAPHRASPADYALSTREKEVLAGMVNGKPSKQIASELGLSIKSVDTYAANIYRKLGVRNRSHAVGIAVRDALVPLEPPK